VRIGRLVKFTPSYDRAADIGWEAEFEWMSRDDQAFVRDSDAEPSPRTGFDLFAALQDALGAIAAVVQLANNWVAAIVTQVNEIGDMVAGFCKLLELAATLVNLPATLIGAITNAANQLVRTVTSLLRQILSPRGTSSPLAQFIAKPTGNPTSRKSSAAGGGARGGAAPVASAMANTIRFEAWRHNVGRAAGNISSFALSERDRILARVSPRDVKIITVGEGQSLFTIAAAQYGSPDFAGYIAAVNKLGTTNVKPGLQLRIPPRPSGTIPLPGSSTRGGVCRA
jgi:hypothetical protein